VTRFEISVFEERSGMENRDLSGYCDNLSQLLRRVSVTRRSGVPVDRDEGALEVVEFVVDARHAERKVMAIGNGGSATIASHLVNDLTKSVGVRAKVFTDISLLTAISNDEGYEFGYEQQVAQWAEPGDVLFAISSSGRSVNILRAAQHAAGRGVRVVTLSGFDPDNVLRRHGVLNFHVPSHDYGPVELSHGVIAHYLTDVASAVVACEPNLESRTEPPRCFSAVVESRESRRGGLS